MRPPAIERQPRLDIPAEVEAWVNELRAEGVQEHEIVEQLELIGSAEALVRCARLCLNRRRHDQARSYAMQARRAGRQDVRLYSDAILAVCDSATERTLHPRPPGMSPDNQIFILRRVLGEIRVAETRTLLLEEAEMRAWMFLSLAHQNAGDFGSALDAARTAKHLAGGLGLPQAVNACVNMICCQLSLLGSLQEAHGELSSALKSDTVPHIRADYQRQVAEILFVGGHYDRVRDILLGVVGVDPSSTWGPVHLLLYGALEGFVSDRQVPPGERLAELLRPVVEGLKCIVEAEALPRTNEHMQGRLALYRKASSHVAAARYEKERYLGLVGSWLRAYCSLRQGHWLESLREVERCGPVPEEWLNLRALIAGLRLELGLNWRTGPFVSVSECEDELRQVWELAGRLSFGHPEGLARRQVRWHPLAAAYMAVHPEPIAELRAARDFIISFRMGSRVLGMELEPAYANESVLRGLSVDLTRPRFEQATRNNRIRAQIAGFSVPYGEASLWRQPLSVVPLIYGLATSGHPDRLEQAQALLAEFGVYAEGKSSAHNATLRGLEKAVRTIAASPMRDPRAVFLGLLPKALRP